MGVGDASLNEIRYFVFLAEQLDNSAFTGENNTYYEYYPYWEELLFRLHEHEMFE